MTDTLRTADPIHDATVGYYEDFAAQYAEHVPDWQGAVGRQANVLHRIISGVLGRDQVSILDCTCGVGTQAIGLAALGHDVVGSDVSRAAIREARRNAIGHGVNATFEVCDMRDLGERDGTFDAVLSIDNSLPHLLTDGDLVVAARGMRDRLRTGGLAVLSMRDYDRLLPGESRPTTTQPKVWHGPDGLRIAFQTWDWISDHCYQVEQFLLRQRDHTWHTTSFSGATYRAWRREDVSRAFRAAGFHAIDWQFPADNGFHQPVALAVHQGP